MLSGAKCLNARRWKVVLKKFLTIISIVLLLTGCSKSEEEKKSWKQEYIEVVEEWQSEKGKDALGYEFIYLDDDDIPELVLYCNVQAYWGFDIYTIYEGAATKLELYDLEGGEKSLPYTSTGRQMQFDAYIPQKGLYYQMEGMLGITRYDVYILEDGRLKGIFSMSSFQLNESDKKKYETAYLDKESWEIVEDRDIESNSYFQDFLTKMDKMYEFSFDDALDLDIENELMDYNEVMEYLQK